MRIEGDTKAYNILEREKNERKPTGNFAGVIKEVADSKSHQSTASSMDRNLQVWLVKQMLSQVSLTGETVPESYRDLIEGILDEEIAESVADTTSPEMRPDLPTSK